MILYDKIQSETHKERFEIMKRLLSALLIVMTALSCFSVVASAVETTTVEENPLEGKSVLFVGDSICEAACEWNSPEYSKTVGWAGRIISENKMTGLNKGKSGASISNCRGINTVIAQLASQKGVKYDYVILHGGVNDAWDSAAVGIMTEGFDGPFDQKTFGGGLEATIKYAKENFKDAQFGYIINFSLPEAKYGRISDMSEYFELAKKICDKWEIPYLDMYNDDELNNKKLYTNITANLPDYIHPNSSGYNIITPVINDWMKTLGEEEDSPESLIPETESKASVPESPKTDDGNMTAYYIIGIVAALVIVACIVFVIITLTKKK